MHNPDNTHHPLLDANLARNDPGVAELLRQRYQAAAQSEPSYHALLGRMLNPVGEADPPERSRTRAARYVRGAHEYLDGVLAMLPADVAQSLEPTACVRNATQIDELLRLVFESGTARTRFEAQRALYVTKLLFDVEHCRAVQDGVRHKQFFEKVLRRELFTRIVIQRPVDVCYHLATDGVSVEYALDRCVAEQGRRRWRCTERRLRYPLGSEVVELLVYRYACRFKLEVQPEEPDELGHLGQSEREARTTPGAGSAIEAEFGPSEPLRQRSASLVSKMIRNGYGDPRRVDDLIGAMIVVEDAAAVERLKRILVELFAGPFRLRGMVDTLGVAPPRGELNPHADGGYRVFKCVLDVLYRPEERPTAKPYFFPVELQVYPLEAYLRTIHNGHHASHAALKRRQLLRGLVPHLFPTAIYGAASTTGCDELR